jgi:hypothetical protein
MKRYPQNPVVLEVYGGVFRHTTYSDDQFTDWENLKIPFSAS